MCHWVAPIKGRAWGTFITLYTWFMNILDHSLSPILNEKTLTKVWVMHRGGHCQQAGASDSQMPLSVQDSRDAMQGVDPCIPHMLVEHVGKMLARGGGHTLCSGGTFAVLYCMHPSTVATGHCSFACSCEMPEGSCSIAAASG